MKDKLALIKKQFPKGTWIELHHMEGEPQMLQGLKGIITSIDDFEQIHVQWENGSHLALNLDVDSFRLLSLHQIEEYEVLKINPIDIHVEMTCFTLNLVVKLNTFDYQFFKMHLFRNHDFIKSMNEYEIDSIQTQTHFIVTDDFNTGYIVNSMGTDYAKYYVYVDDLSRYPIVSSVEKNDST